MRKVECIPNFDQFLLHGIPNRNTFVFSFQPAQILFFPGCINVRFTGSEFGRAQFAQDISCRFFELLGTEECFGIDRDKEVSQMIRHLFPLFADAGEHCQIIAGLQRGR